MVRPAASLPWCFQTTTRAPHRFAQAAAATCRSTDRAARRISPSGPPTRRLWGVRLAVQAARWRAGRAGVPPLGNRRRDKRQMATSLPGGCYLLAAPPTCWTRQVDRCPSPRSCGSGNRRGNRRARQTLKTTSPFHPRRACGTCQAPPRMIAPSCPTRRLRGPCTARHPACLVHMTGGTVRRAVGCTRPSRR